MREHLIDEIGKQLGPEYVDIRTMIEGGMGTLFRAHRLGLDVDVVIKRVKQQYVGTLDQRAEANILKRLKHSYLPRIYDIIQGSDGYVYALARATSIPPIVGPASCVRLHPTCTVRIRRLSTRILSPAM